MLDIAIPVVFPDYLIAVDSPRAVEIPDLLPGIDLLPDKLPLPEYTRKVPELGHAGILFIEGQSGTTKYFEYGRYDPQKLGRVEQPRLRDVRMSGGHPAKADLAYVLSQISASSGQQGRIAGAYIGAIDAYRPMLTYAEQRKRANTDPRRQPYDILRNSCNHFMRDVLSAGGIKTPVMLDPRPNSYIEELRDNYPPLDYDKREHRLSVQNGPAALARAELIRSQPAAA